ncbi:hypothetical protein MKW98_029491 [Papaver atlanticum]|uniref:Uncharacterized protein n=1 Tax=Papaver atlanticum TaxID=357466 RepID=A0AAD4SHH2_9MAGN|nr:hypothetical protein MKW98_029491 [Papaver atlanticum]
MSTILEHKYQEFLDGLVNILGENNPAYQELLDEAVNALGDKHREVFTPPKYVKASTTTRLSLRTSWIPVKRCVGSQIML